VQVKSESETYHAHEEEEEEEEENEKNRADVAVDGQGEALGDEGRTSATAAAHEVDGQSLADAAVDPDSRAHIRHAADRMPTPRVGASCDVASGASDAPSAAGAAADRTANANHRACDDLIARFHRPGYPIVHLCSPLLIPPLILVPLPPSTAPPVLS
jgi:hypothetical protein